MFAVINVCGLANQNISLLLMFMFLFWGELDGKLCFTKMVMTPLIMIRFSKFNLVLKLDNENYKCLRTINVCEFAKNTKFANNNHAQHLLIYSIKVWGHVGTNQRYSQIQLSKLIISRVAER